MRRRLHIALLMIPVVFSWNMAAFAGKYIDLLPRTSGTSPEFSAAALREELASMPLHHIEGIWRFPADGTEIAIMRSAASRHEAAEQVEGYRIVLLFSHNRALRPGTVIGRISPAAKESNYDARIYTVVKGSSLMVPRQFNLKIDGADNRIVFDRKKSALSVNPWRLLPYAWRYVVRRNSQGASTAGCVRVFPAPELPYEPIYL